MSAATYGDVDHRSVLRRIFKVQNGLQVAARSCNGDVDNYDVAMGSLLELFAERLGELASDLSEVEDLRERGEVPAPTPPAPSKKKARQ